MRNRPWMIVVSGLITIAATLGMPGAGNAASDERSFVTGYFALTLADTAAGFLSSVEDEGAAADVVTEQVANAPIGTLPCRVGITFYSAAGAVLHAKELKLAPGVIGTVDLPAQQFSKGGSFRISFQVLDEDKKGKIRPCLAIPSARVYERQSGKTKYYLPIVIK